MFDGGDSNVRKFNTVNRRVFILKIAKGIIFTGIVARLFSLQITENKKYLTPDNKQQNRHMKKLLKIIMLLNNQNYLNSFLY